AAHVPRMCLDAACLSGPVVRSLAGDRHVVDMALAQARAGDADELAAAAHRGDRRMAGIAHRRAEPADELVEGSGGRALVGDLALDTLGDKLVGAGFLLEIAVGGAARHPPDRSPAAV